ncbi:MAG TPA: AmmeMemoRadiSam system protein A [Candidatus Saccharimonadales bacterium]|nr:AmmeMemoRadiSam system protein A [Candidatus Saccharimonadales bacterium]
MTDFPAEYSPDERRWLLQLAHQSIAAAVARKPLPTFKASPHLREPRGAFTTLHKNGTLRGCIGHVIATEPLDDTIRRTARAAALEDPRFPPVTEPELNALQIEISVLSPMFQIAPQDVVVGRHGLMVTFGSRRGLLLPQVATEHHWDRETFLTQTCRKANIPPDMWTRGATLEAFTAEVFGDLLRA